MTDDNGQFIYLRQVSNVVNEITAVIFIIDPKHHQENDLSLEDCVSSFRHFE